MTNKPRILINCLLLSQSSGGFKSYFEKVIIPLTFQLNKDNASTRILLPESSIENYKSQLPSDQIIIDQKNKKGMARVLYEQRLVPILVRKHKFTKVFTPYQIGPTKIQGAECILMFRNMEPYVASKYEYPLPQRLRSTLLRWFGKLYLRQAEHVIVVSEFTRNFIVESQNIDTKKITVISHGIEISESRDNGSEEDYILTVTSFSPYKRLEDLIIAFNLLKVDSNLSTKLVIVGGGKDQKYINKINTLINKSSFKRDIILRGKLLPVELENLFTSCKLFVMTSEVEACPNTALEAMAYKCAIISTTNQPMPEFFGEAVVYYKNRDPVDLASKIEQLLLDKSKRTYYRQQAHLQSKKYGLDDTISKTKYLLLN